MEVISQFAWIGWIVLILVFVIIEMLSLDFVFLMIAIGSVGGLISGLLGVPWWGQLVVAAVLSLLLIFFLRPPLLHALRKGGDPAKSNVPALIGLEAQVVRSFGADGIGLVKLANGETWTARLDAVQASAESVAQPGDRLQVTAIEGATAVVAPAGRTVS